MGVDLNQMPSKPDMLQGDAEVVFDFDDQSLGVTLDDFVPGSDYWTVLMVMAERQLAGQSPLAV